MTPPLELQGGLWGEPRFHSDPGAGEDWPMKSQFLDDINYYHSIGNRA